MSVSDWRIRHCARIVRDGGVIAYPTEGVYGLGCDPANQEAVMRLLALKRRSVRQGLIIIAADYSQIEPWLDLPDSEQTTAVLATWPGAVTWVLPARVRAPWWVRGQYASLAVRVTAHPLASALCRQVGPLVSTSANWHRQAPALTARQVRRTFRGKLDDVLPGSTGGLTGVSEIREFASGRILRKP